MTIQLVKENKKRYLGLLLLADEQESMIDLYLERGDLFVLSEGEEAIAVAVVTPEGNGIHELKNLAVAEAYQRGGYGRRMIDFIWDYYKDKCNILMVGTGDSPMTVPFYERCGFEYSHTVPNFFTDNYDHPIIDGGKVLTDMLYFKRERKEDSNIN